MPFPSTPADGQIYRSPSTNEDYIYSSTNSMWRKRGRNLIQDYSGLDASVATPSPNQSLKSEIANIYTGSTDVDKESQARIVSTATPNDFVKFKGYGDNQFGETIADLAFVNPPDEIRSGDMAIYMDKDTILVGSQPQPTVFQSAPVGNAFTPVGSYDFLSSTSLMNVRKKGMYFSFKFSGLNIEEQNLSTISWNTSVSTTTQKIYQVWLFRGNHLNFAHTPGYELTDSGVNMRDHEQFMHMEEQSVPTSASSGTFRFIQSTPIGALVAPSRTVPISEGDTFTLIFVSADRSSNAVPFEMASTAARTSHYGIEPVPTTLLNFPAGYTLTDLYDPNFFKFRFNLDVSDLPTGQNTETYDVRSGFSLGRALETGDDPFFFRGQRMDLVTGFPPSSYSSYYPEGYTFFNQSDGNAYRLSSGSWIQI